MNQDTLRKALELPEDAPIPGAMYRRKLGNGQWEFATVIALELLGNDRWVAVFASVRFGEERITSEHNNLRSYELHSIPQAASAAAVSTTSNGAKDALDILLSAGA